MTSLDYAEDLTTLWRQYRRHATDHKELARQDLGNIIAHCDVALTNGADENYFTQQRRRASALIVENYPLPHARP